jgi:tetratricopeptide (TPR) repeat protein
MRAFVFTDPALGKHAGRFVWLAINGEKAVNAPFRRQYKIPAFPTYYVLDPRDGQVLNRWIGSASVAQLDRLFDEQSAGYARRVGRGAELTMADATLRAADSLYAADAHPQAAALYAQAIADAPANWAPRARAIDARLFSLSEADSAEACVTLAEAELPTARHTTAGANIAGSGLGCALHLPPEAPRRAERIAALEAACREILADRSLDLQGDDRSGLYISLLDARDDASDSLGHLKVAEQWSAFLDGEAARATNPTARVVFDPHRLSAYMESGHAERAIPMLEQSQRDFPDDYNPPARLAIAYRALKRWDEGLAASDRAMKLAYGPRKITFFQTRADLYKGKGDLDGARRTLEEAVAYAEALPDGQRSNATIASLKKRLEALK